MNNEINPTSAASGINAAGIARQRLPQPRRTNAITNSTAITDTLETSDRESQPALTGDSQNETPDHIEPAGGDILDIVD